MQASFAIIFTVETEEYQFVYHITICFADKVVNIINNRAICMNNCTKHDKVQV